MSRSLLAAVVAACAAITPAAAWAQDRPTLAFDKPCYSAGDPVGFTGAGYSPNGEVNFLFAAGGRVGSYDTRADGAGALFGRIGTPEVDHFLDDDEVSATLTVTANDRARIDAGAPPEQQFGAAQFTLSRYGIRLLRRGGGAPRAALPMRVEVAGWTHAIGEVLYLHYRRGGRTVKSVRLGRLAGDCGDRTVTLRRGVPRGARPGRYRLVFNTSARDARSKPRMTTTLRLR
jgi:hypothetical protein